MSILRLISGPRYPRNGLADQRLLERFARFVQNRPATGGPGPGGERMRIRRKQAGEPVWDDASQTECRALIREFLLEEDLQRERREAS